MKKVDPFNLSLEELMQLAQMQGRKARKSRPYAQNAYDEFKALAKKYGDPDRLTLAKRKRITRLARYAAFASFGEWSK